MMFALTRRKTALLLPHVTSDANKRSTIRFRVSPCGAALHLAVGASWSGPAAAAVAVANNTTPGLGTLGGWWPSFYAWFGGVF